MNTELLKKTGTNIAAGIAGAVIGFVAAGQVSKFQDWRLSREYKKVHVMGIETDLIEHQK